MLEAIEIIRQILENGLTFITLLAVVQILFNWYESKRKRRVYERIEAKQDFMMKEMGLQWTGQRKPLHPVLMSLKQWQQLYLTATSLAGSLYRRRITMNKTWLVTLVTYILAQIAIRTGVVIPTEMANWIVDGLMLLIPIALAFMNKTKSTQSVKPVRPQDVDPDTFAQGG